MRVLSEAHSFCVAAFCWAQRGRAPEVDEAAQFHLNVLRQRGCFPMRDLTCPASSTPEAAAALRTA